MVTKGGCGCNCGTSDNGTADNGTTETNIELLAKRRKNFGPKVVENKKQESKKVGRR